MQFNLFIRLLWMKHAKKISNNPPRALYHIICRGIEQGPNFALHQDAPKAVLRLPLMRR